VLAAFVRQHAVGLPKPEGNTIDAQLAALESLASDEKRVKLRADIAAAIDVLGRRSWKDDADRVNLDGVNFCRIEFSTMVDFERTSFVRAQLQYSRMMFANLRGCHMLSTELQGTDLAHSDLRGARIVLANLHKADFDRANLEGAEFTNVDLSDALNLTIDQLKVATLEYTTLPDYIDPAALAAARQPQPPAA